MIRNYAKKKMELFEPIALNDFSYASRRKKLALTPYVTSRSTEASASR